MTSMMASVGSWIVGSGTVVDPDVAPAVPHRCLHRLPPAVQLRSRPELVGPPRRYPRPVAASRTGLRRPDRGYGTVMRIVVTGASGNVGASLVSVLGDDPGVDVVVGVARRRPTWFPPKVDWVTADVAVDDLDPIVEGADAVVHLSWLIQPSRESRAMWATNVVGTRRVVDAVARAHVPVLVAASSVGVYSPAAAGQMVDESWPTDGTPESTVLVAEGARGADPRRPRRAPSGVSGRPGAAGADLQAGLGSPRPQPVHRPSRAAQAAAGRGRRPGRRAASH